MEDRDRFAAWYCFTGDEAEARAKAKDLCLEQTVECPAEILPAGFIPDQVVGRVEALERTDRGAHRALIARPEQADKRRARLRKLQ